MILVDTNVVSETLQPKPSQQVIAWLNRRFSECAFSSIGVFELYAGVAVLPKGARRDHLQTATTRIVRRFGARTYSFDTPAAHASAKLLGEARARGLAVHQLPAKLADLQLAGIAAAYGLGLATRNTGDFKGLGLKLLNPWTDEA